MIDITVPIIFIIGIVAIQFITIFEEIKAILIMTIVSGLFYTLKLTSENAYQSKIFSIISIIIILCIPIYILVKYIEKIK